MNTIPTSPATVGDRRHPMSRRSLARCSTRISLVWCRSSGSRRGPGAGQARMPRYIGEYDLSDSSRFGWTVAVRHRRVASWRMASACRTTGSPGRPARASLAAAIVAPAVVLGGPARGGGALIPRLLVVGSAPFFFIVFLISGAVRRASVTAATSRAGILAILDRSEEADFVADLKGPLNHAIELRRVTTIEDLEAEGGLLVVARASRATLLVLGRGALDDPRPGRASGRAPCGRSAGPGRARVLRGAGREDPGPGARSISPDVRHRRGPRAWIPAGSRLLDVASPCSDSSR